MESSKSEGHTNRKKTDWKQVGHQAKKEWCAQEQIGGTWTHTNAWCEFHRCFLSVVQDVMLRIALTMWLVLGLDEDQMDVETAFMEGD